MRQRGLSLWGRGVGRGGRGERKGARPGGKELEMSCDELVSMPLCRGTQRRMRHISQRHKRQMRHMSVCQHTCPRNKKSNHFIRCLIQPFVSAPTRPAAIGHDQEDEGVVAAAAERRANGCPSIHALQSCTRIETHLKEESSSVPCAV